MTKREKEILDWLHGPSVTLYDDERRLQEAQGRSQTADEAIEAARKYPLGYYQRHAMSPEAVREANAANERAREKRREYRKIPPRSAEEREELLAKLAKRAARADYLRTDPWKGLDTNPWGVTAAERKRWGLGPSY